MPSKFFQDHYPEDFAHCYGCGYLNEHGLHIKSAWEGEEAVCRFEPRSYHTAFPGFAYGGLIASIIDCHSVGAAAAAWMRANGLEFGPKPLVRFVTGRLEVDYLRPTPIATVLEVRSRIVEVGKKKAVVESEMFAEGVVCARGRVVAVKMPEDLVGQSRSS
jgi:acyl-coenzyme A thioesterase PaaI-like protein